MPVCLEEVSFESNGLRLAGQWFIPREDGPFPAVVLIRGSGDSVRGNPWTEMLVSVLLDAGVAALVPDKRGSGDSEGDWRRVGFMELAEDALAGVHYLASRSDAAPDRIGVMGLSQGGQIAPIAAARSQSVAFVINVVGGATPFLENVRYEMVRTFEEAGLSGRRLQAAVDMLGHAEGYMSGTLPWDAYTAEVDEARRAIGDRIVDTYFIQTPDHWRWDFFRGLMEFDPVDWWRRVDQPVLVLLGERDPNTPTAETAARLDRVFAESGHTDTTVRVFEGLGHDLMDHSAPGPMSEHGLHPDVRVALRTWIQRVTAS